MKDFKLDQPGQEVKQDEGDSVRRSTRQMKSEGVLQIRTKRKYYPNSRRIRPARVKIVEPSGVETERWDTGRPKVTKALWDLEDLLAGGEVDAPTVKLMLLEMGHKEVTIERARLFAKEQGMLGSSKRGFPGTMYWRLRGVRAFEEEEEVQVNTQESEPKKLSRSLAVHESRLLDVLYGKLEFPPLVWIDLETTGLNPCEDKILEIAVVATDANLDEMSRQGLIFDLNRVELRKIDPDVIEMHAKSGLWADCSRFGQTDGYHAKGELLEYFQSVVEDSGHEKFVMAGASVHFDREFLFYRWPEMEKFFSHRVVDVSSIKELLKRWNPAGPVEPREGPAHRAMEDVLHSIRELRGFRDQGLFKC